MGVPKRTETEMTQSLMSLTFITCSNPCLSNFANLKSFSNSRQLIIKLLLFCKYILYSLSINSTTKTKPYSVVIYINSFHSFLDNNYQIFNQFSVKKFSENCFDHRLRSHSFLSFPLQQDLSHSSIRNQFFSRGSQYRN